MSNPVTGTPTFGEAVRFWTKLGFISFGGPAAQIAIMHTELVEKRRWISESKFLHALNFCMLLPGPEAQQLATYIGWLLHGTKGGIAAGALFVLPSMLILWLLSYAYIAYGHVPALAAFFHGLQPAVLALVLLAVLRIGSKVLKNTPMRAIAAMAFVAIFFFKVNFALIVGVAGLIGFLGGKYSPKQFLVLKGHGDDGGSVDDTAPVRMSRTLRVLATCLALWWLPLIAVGLALGWKSVWFQQGLFFSKAALVTFGGAYAVLPFVAQKAVEQYGWLTMPQMMSGLALAETTPGPLIMVLQFVGFVGAWQNPGTMSPLAAATLGALVTTWATFLPCFLFILVGAPYVERLRNVKLMTSALSAITAAVVGVVLNLAVWFGLHALRPEPGAFNVYAAVVAVICFVGMKQFKWNVIPTILLSGVAGVVWALVIRAW